MHALRNKTRTQYGQVIESQIDLLGDVFVDFKDKMVVFKNLDTGLNLLRIKQIENQLYYQVYNEGDWSIDIPLTLSDPDQVFNLPQEPVRVNNNTYLRVKEDFKLYDEGSMYIRMANDPPTLFVSSSISFALEEDEGSIATISSTGLGMNSHRITELANPAADTDAVNRQFLDKYDLPIGTIQSYWGYTAPAGFLVCDGTSFAEEDYPELYALLGNSNTLPNLQGAFLRGASNGINPTLDTTNPRAVRTYQTDDNKAHTHGVTYVDTYATENIGTNLGFLGHSDPDYDN